MASDGESRRFREGGALAIEDVVGKGHATRVVGTEEAHLAFASLAE